tara:strand:+ start:194 stop:316 length:123 start_codon:yes stop_codon:yes gene_type:complete
MLSKKHIKSKGICVGNLLEISKDLLILDVIVVFVIGEIFR